MTAASSAPLPNETPHPAKRVALVFDDGPDPKQAEPLMKLLAQEGLRVTFAHVGSALRSHPEISRRAQAAGHEIVNHSLEHRDPFALDSEELAEEITGAQALMSQLLEQAPRWYWPPFLKVDARVETAVREAGIGLYRPAHVVSSEDWNRMVGAEEIRHRATTGVTDGAVILFHEWRSETLEQLPAILAELRRQRCVFLTFSELERELEIGTVPGSSSRPGR